MKKKVLATLLSMAMVAGVITGCGSAGTQSAADQLEEQGVTEIPAAEATAEATEAEAPAAEPAELDLSQQVDLVFYVMGDAPQDEELVEAALNEKLLEKCNATVDMQFSTWTDFQQKYANEITAQSADLIYIANWLNYGQLASSGAFEELDDMLDTAEGILFNGDPDNGLLPFICKLDSKDEVHDPDNWEKANPSLPYLPSLRLEIEKEYRDWKKNPARLPAFITKRMNIRDSALEIKVTDYDNIKATKNELPNMKGWTCTVGIDFTKVTDWASVCFHFKQGDKRYDISHSWMCSASKDKERLRCPWEEWAANGRLTVVDDVEIHPVLLTDFIYSMRMDYVIKGVAIDDFRYALMASALKEIGFDPKEKKNLKLVKPSDIMRVTPVIDSCFANKNFVWGDAPELRWATNNTKLVKYGRNPAGGNDLDLGNYVYGKIEAKSRKTDPFMALVAAMTIESKIIERRAGPTRKLPVMTY